MEFSKFDFIKGIVVLLKGSDAKSQVIACETLCNLSLGNSVPCEKIATAAGSYLITHLDSSELRLKVCFVLRFVGENPGIDGLVRPGDSLFLHLSLCFR